MPGAASDFTGIHTKLVDRREYERPVCGQFASPPQSKSGQSNVTSSFISFPEKQGQAEQSNTGQGRVWQGRESREIQEVAEQGRA